MGLTFAMGNDGGVSETIDEAPLSLLERPPSRAANVMAATGLTASLIIALLTVIPSRYAIQEPGPTYDTLATVDGLSLVEIEGAPTYDSSGELRLTTVSVLRGGSQKFTVGSVIAAFFSPASTVTPEETVFGDAADEEADKEASAQQWISSQESATVSALEARGTVVPATITVAEVMDTSHAVDLLQPEDVLVAGDGVDFVSYADLTAFLEGHLPGDTITLTVSRAGEKLDVDFALIGSEGDAKMGIYVDPSFDLPIDVTVGIDQVGGPSAGLMFALAIMDRLSPEDELDGALVAGTGQIDADGEIYPIGGIAHKLYGARAAGAEYFLAPVENCAEVVGHVPDGLSVYAVDQLDDAYAAMVAIGEHDTAGLPTCSADDNE